MNPTCQAETPRLTLVSSVEPIRRQPTESIEPIQFLQAISASLELEQVLLTLNRFLHDLVAHAGWEYRYAESGVELSGGKPDRHRLEYALTLNGQDMGVLKLMRGRRFSDTDQVRIEGLLGLAAQALHHALRFHELNRQLERDPLTGLGNRRALAAQGAQWLADSLRQQQPLSMLVLDLDHFKAVNDNYGHPLGDRLLCALAETLRALTRTSDLCVRMGGDEFVVLLPRSDLSDALECAERIRRAVAQLSFNTASEPVRPTVSIGVATYRSGAGLEQTPSQTEAARHTDLTEAMECAERMRRAIAKLSGNLALGATVNANAGDGFASSHVGMDLDLLYHQADDALYAAKRAGCNQVLAGLGNRGQRMDLVDVS